MKFHDYHHAIEHIVMYEQGFAEQQNVFFKFFVFNKNFEFTIQCFCLSEFLAFDVTYLKLKNKPFFKHELLTYDT